MKRTTKGISKRRMKPLRKAGKSPARVPMKSFLKLGENLRRLRMDRELSQERLADLANVHWTQVSRLERGTLNPSLRSLIRLAKGLDCRLEELVSEIL